MGNPDSSSVDEQTDAYLSGRRKRKLEEAKQAELEHVAEEEKTEAARQRKERELIEAGKVSPMGHKEGSMESEEEKAAAAAEKAAEVAAEAVNAGVDTEEAKNLATGKKAVVVVTPPGSKENIPVEERWEVLDGKPVKDPEGEYTFSQALKVASLGKGEGDSMSILKWLKSEGFFGGQKGDEFMGTFMKELATKSVDNIIGKPNPSGSSDAAQVAMREEIKSLREEFALATDPVASAKRVQDMFSTFRSLGLIHEGGAGGESLETVKETHRHEEKMEEVRSEKEYKASISKTLSEIPERMGKGMASDIEEGEEEAAGSGSEKLEYITCQEEGCGTKFPIPPEAGNQVECPTCGAIYTRKGTVESEPKAPKKQKKESS